MSGSRRNAPYPKGSKLQATKAWAQRVDAQLKDNKENDRDVSDRAKLARAIKADKGGLNRFLDGLLAGEVRSSKWVPAICKELGIDPPMRPTGETDDDLAKFVDDLDADARRRALAILRAAMGDD